MSDHLAFKIGNILDFHGPYYIAHQCNCTTKGARGLAQQIFSILGNNVYQMPGIIRQPGTNILCGKVVNMFAQIAPGKGRNPADGAQQRLQYFKSCLQQLGQALPADARIAFPYKIGCGLAGGDWDLYLVELQQFAKSHPDMEVLVVARPEDM